MGVRSLLHWQFVLQWGWKGQGCSLPGWLMGNDLGQGSVKLSAEGISQLHTSWAVKQDCLITTFLCRNPPGSHTPWLCGRWGIWDVEFLRLLTPPA